MKSFKTHNERFYYSMQRIRRVEEKIAEIYHTDKIKSPVHLSIGQEAISVGVCEALSPSDVVFGTYRGHALYLAKGGCMKAMMAELYGKIDGCAKGKAGSMHLVDTDVGMMGTSAVVATTIPNATGYAFAEKYKGTDTIVANFFGDGAIEEGVFYESMNFASIWKLPIIYICENNLYAIHAHLNDRQTNSDIIGRVKSFDIETHKIEANDGQALYEITKESAERFRKDKEARPVFVECPTYRFKEHVGPGEDFHLEYRTREEAQQWIENDPLAVLGRELGEDKKGEIDDMVEHELEEAMEFAEASPFPASEELYTDLFKS